MTLQENYLNHRPSIARDEATRLRAIAKAADALSHGDVVNRAVRQYGNWGLMPFAAMVGSVLPAAYMRGMRETFNLYPGEPNFPRWVLCLCALWMLWEGSCFLWGEGYLLSRPFMSD